MMYASHRPFAVSFVIALLLMLVGCAGAQQTTSPPAADTPPPTDTTEQTAEAARPDGMERVMPYPVEPPIEFLGAVDRGWRTLEGVPGPDYWQQEADYALTARLLPDEKRLEGTVQITYTNNAPVALNVLFLELAQNLHAPGVVRNEAVEVTGGIELDSMTVDGREVTEGGQGPRYLIDGTVMGVVLPNALQPGDSVDLEIAFGFTIPQAGASGRMGYSGDNLFFLAYWYPRMRVFDDVIGWHLEPFLGRAEFYHGFGDYEMTIEAPEGWIVMATGGLENADEVLDATVLDRMLAAHQSDTPLPVLTSQDNFDEATRPSETGYLSWRFTAEQVRDVAFTVTRDTNWDAARTPVGDANGDGADDYTIINTFYRDLAPRWEHVTRYQQHAITFLSDFTGFPYPWPHMTAVEGSEIIGGGMEFPMMTIMGDYNAAGDSALYFVTAHELAHMWIPMIVGTNERSYSWIDEGSTSFAENQARFDFYPGPDHNLPDQNSYIQVALSGMEGEIMRRSNYHYSSQAFGTASYAKPATVLVALREVLGEEVFQEAYQAFVDSWAFKHPYPYDFFNTFERVSGRDLDWFWRSWYYETWLLDQSIAEVTSSPNGIQVTIEDLGRIPMPVPIRVTYANGTTAEQTLPVDVWLDEGATVATATFEPGTVSRVEIDPSNAFPDIDHSNNVWTP